MALWPFGRKNKSKSAPATLDDQNMAADSKSSAAATGAVSRGTQSDRPGSDRSAPTLGRPPTQKETQKRARSSSRRLSKSNAPGMRGSEKADAVPPIPMLPNERRKELSEKSGPNKLNQQPVNQPPQDRSDIPSYYLQNPLSTSSLHQKKYNNILDDPPTLKAKRSATDGGYLPRRKSSRRKTESHAREQEIKAMSSPIPIPKRPTSHQPGLLARDSKQLRDGLNRNGRRPMSDVSLPMQEAMQSQISISTDQHAFKVSAFDALSPRPTIRYSANPRSPRSSNQPSRTSTRKEKQPMLLEEETEQSMKKKRIADLADDMDSPSLRELMEREQRRLDTRRRSEHERLTRRLERRAARQEEQERKQAEGENDAAGKGKDGLGIEEAAAAALPLQKETKETLRVVPASKDDGGTGTRTPESWLHDPSRENLGILDPFHDPIKGGSTSHLAPATPTEDEPVLETAKAVRLSSASMSPPMSPIRHTHEPSSLSQMSTSFDPPEPPPKLDLDRRRESDSSPSNRFSSNWKSIFRRSDTRGKRESADRGRITPSEFSNTSRDSVTAQMPTSAFPGRIPRARSGTSVRTQSKFREDLPELPISPPGSRMQSPEAAVGRTLPDIPGSRGNDSATLGVVDPSQRLSDIHPAYRDEIALSRNDSLRNTSAQDTANLSQSLASVDSEGSWLTGRPVKRQSGPLSRDSAGSLAQQLRALRGPEDRDAEDESGNRGVGDDDEEPPGTPDAEKYMGSLTPAPPETKPAVPQRRRPHIASLAANQGDGSSAPGGSPETSLHSGPALNMSEQEGTWHPPVGKHPTIVNQGPGPRAKSREGLLNDFQAAETSPESSPSGDYSPNSPEMGGNAFPNTIQRATSVDLGKGHARHISAGSARLLNLPPRSSTEIKRLSASSGERSPLSTTALRVPEDEVDDEVD